MTLEHWDAEKRKYVLYRTNEQHAEDCNRNPFERIPLRVFLDTNVVNVLVKNAAQIFDQAEIPADVDETLAKDIEALRHVFFVGFRADWSLFGSPKTIEELKRTADEELRAELVEYALGFVNQHTLDEDRRFALDFGRRMMDAPFVGALPDRADRELIGNAIGLRCDAFCTRDRKTIVRKRDRMKQLSLRIITPAEWWATIRPWAALWC